MNRQSVKKAYDSIRPTQADKDRMLKAILSQSSDLPPMGKDVPMIQFKKKRKPVLVAAVIGLMVILMGCAVAALKLQDLKIGQDSYTEPAHYQENGEKVAAADKTRDVLSLQGIAGSPNQQAAQEWYEFEKSYDPDGKLCAQADASGYTAPAEYQAYFVYTQEMIDKVDEICRKYDLKLAGAETLVQQWQTDVFLEALGIDSLFQKDAQVEAGIASGYFYECGNFHMEFAFTLTGGGWPHEIWASMRYIDKDYFDTVYAAVDDVNTAEQWNATLSDGTEVLIVNLGQSARIFCDREDAFVSVRFDTSYTDDNGSTQTMSKQAIQLAAEAINFAVKPRKPDMAEVKVKMEEADAEYAARQEKALQDAMAKPQEDPFSHDSYQELLTYISENEDLPWVSSRDLMQNGFYALMDFTGDGEEELILGTEDDIETIWTMRDGKTFMLTGGDGTGYLCEGGIFEQYYFEEGQPMHYYSGQAAETGEYQVIAYVGYDAYAGTWKYVDHTQDDPNSATGGLRKEVTEEEAKQIIDSYVRIPVTMKPLSEFPMN